MAVVEVDEDGVVVPVITSLRTEAVRAVAVELTAPQIAQWWTSNLDEQTVPPGSMLAQRFIGYDRARQPSKGTLTSHHRLPPLDRGGNPSPMIGRVTAPAASSPPVRLAFCV